MTDNIATKSSPAPRNPDLELGHELGVARRAVNRWRHRLENARTKLPVVDQVLAEAAFLERTAQALLAHRDRIHPGSCRVCLPDYTSEGVGEVEISLDPARSLESFTRQRFHQATRLRRQAAARNTRQAALDRETSEANDWAERLADFAASLAAPLPEDVPFRERRRLRREASRALAALRERLLPRGLWPQPPGHRDAPAPMVPVRWDLPGGWTLRAGRSGTENDLLTTRLAHADDLWFHAADVPGSHVILRAPGARPISAPPELITLAAGVAAWLSKLRAQESADVLCTAKRYVRKPHGAPVGTVILDHAKRLRVKPVPPPRDAAKNAADM